MKIGVALMVIFGIIISISDFQYASIYKNYAKIIANRYSNNQNVWYLGYWGWQWYATEENLENTTDNETNVEAGTSLLDQQQIYELESKLARLESLALQIQTQVSEINTTNQDVSTLMETLNSDIQEINYQQNQIQEDIDKKINSVSVGLASVQIDLSETQTQLENVEETVLAREKFTRILTYVIFVLVALAAAVLVMYYIQRRGSSKEVDRKSKAYITQMIKRGLKYPAIRHNLIKAGWSEDDINLAYKETLKENYSQYVRKSGSSSGGSFMADTEVNTQRGRSSKDVTKIISLVVVSILIVGGVILLLRGISTGRAIYFQDSMELSSAMEEALNKNIEDNVFYSKLTFTNLCVQAVEKDKEVYNSASFQILKTPKGHSIKEAELPCDQDDTYDFAVKFQSWESFDYLVNGLDCKKINLVNNKEKVAIILPSKYILKGFKLNPDEKAEKFCAALKECLGDAEIKGMGLRC